MNNRIIYKYQVKHSISQNGHTELFIGEHMQLGKQFFLKSMAPADENDDLFRVRFYSEAKLLARLDHPNIMQATDFFQFEDRYWLAMEYFNGPTLEKMLQLNKSFPPQPALHYFKQLLRGLSFAHELGVIHRNIRPDMILLNKSGQLKIADFGVAMIQGDSGRVEIGKTFIDANYLSPEQIINPLNVDQRSDIYSTGVILFQMLTGCLPFKQGSSLTSLMLHLDECAPDIRTINPEIPDKIAEIVAKALEKSPEERFQSCREFLKAIEDYQHSLLPEGTTQKTYSKRTIMFGCSVLAGLALFGMVTYKIMTRESYVTILRLNGSNTIGSKLAPALAEAYLWRNGATKITRQQGSNPEEIIIKGLIDRHNGLAIEIKSHGSSTAFEGLADNSCEIGMSSRRIKNEEIKKLASLGDMTSLASEHILGLDGLAVITNEANSINTLNINELKEIFSGKTSGWQPINGTTAAISVYARDDKSGTFDTFKSLVLGSSKLVATAKRFEDSAMLSSQVSSDKNGIGFIGLPYIKSAKALAIKSGNATPVLPTPFTVATEDYPLARRLYLYTRQQPQNPRISEFVEFALSNEGQEIVEKNGFVSMAIKAATFPPPEMAPPEYKRVTASAERLSLNFKFKENSFKLDNKGQRDLDRLVRALTVKEFQGRPVMLFGFTDNQLPPAQSSELSRARAKTISEELSKRGINAATISGFGSLLPIADNSSMDGKNRNNRVEIWLGKK